MHRTVYGAIIYVVIQLVAQQFITSEVQSMIAHGGALLLAVLIASIITNQNIKIGKPSVVVLISIPLLFGLFKYLQVNFFIRPEKGDLSGNVYLYYFLALGILSIAEELYFRGVVLEDLTKRFNIIIGSTVSVLFFVLIHLDKTILGALSHLITGVIFVMLYNKTKGVLLPALAHVIGNCTVFFYINGI